MNVQSESPRSAPGENLQVLADHATFQEVSPAFHGVPAPPRFHFGTFPAELAAFHYGLCNLGPAGVWRSDALTVSPNLVLRTAGGELVEAQPLNWLKKNIELALARSAPDTDEAEVLTGDVVLMVTPGYPIYGHWLADMLPRLVLLERAGHVLEQLTFLVPSDIPDFALRLLQMIGIEPSRLHRLTRTVRPKRLLMPTFPHNGRQFIALAEEGFRLMKSRIGARFGRLGDAGTPDRILISRDGCGSRKLHNRSDFETLLKEYGFVSMAPQNLPLFKQVTLFASAREVIGEYGSGLHNTVFSPAGTVVCAIRGTLRHPAFIQSGIGDALKQPTGYLFGTCGDHVDHPNFLVDLDAVRDCMRSVFSWSPNRQAHRAAGPVATAIMEVIGSKTRQITEPLETFRQALKGDHSGAALTAGRLLTHGGDDPSGISAEMAELCHKLGNSTGAVRHAIVALGATPGDIKIRQLLATLLPSDASTYPSTQTLHEAKIQINFQEDGNAAPLLGRGWSRKAPEPRWMLNKVSTLTLPELDAKCDWIADLDVLPFALPARLRISMDWVELRRVTFTTKSHAVLRFRLPAEVLASIKPHTITFDHPDTQTSPSIDGRDNVRQIAFEARTLLLTPARSDFPE